MAPNIKANKFPPSSLMACQITTIVKAPNSAGKNLIQKTELPKMNMRIEIQEVKGGTEK